MLSYKTISPTLLCWVLGKARNQTVFDMRPSAQYGDPSLGFYYGRYRSFSWSWTALNGLTVSGLRWTNRVWSRT